MENERNKKFMFLIVLTIILYIVTYIAAILIIEWRCNYSDVEICSYSKLSRYMISGTIGILIVSLLQHAFGFASVDELLDFF